MTKPQIIHASNGEELVVLTRAAYDALIAAAPDVAIDDDDAADLAMLRKARAEWKAAGQPVVPLQVVRRVQAGDTYLKAFRAERGLTQGELAKRAGIAQGYLSEIESERKTPNATTRDALAKALDIHPIWLSDAAPAPTREIADD